MLRRLAPALLFLLAGCAAPVIEAASIARDRAIYSNTLPAAEAGDPVAQLRIGNALCCSVSERQPFYDTQAATEWMCRAAAQGFAPAMFRLGRIHSGSLVDGVRITRRLANAVAGGPDNLPLAWAWFQFAADAGEAEGAARARSVGEDMTPGQRAMGERIRAAGVGVAACTLRQARA
ncbi:hypothetical protein C8P66_10565 [Humitalea rosea]|uniref:Sel1 repeat-containing protein n=1 Tax=Humitalea rosea TaxID=990373 RepID=A0A2W7IMZ5_9PROT|nr:sel1 repeat family protein [Humitalea rosea]PZW48318.1 hypothetical protein C8P66_10565 [Humitalea rosea]